MQQLPSPRRWRRLAGLVVLQVAALGAAALWGAWRAVDQLSDEAGRIGVKVVLERADFKLRLSAQFDLGTTL